MEKKFKEKQWILVRKKNQDRAKWEAFIYMYEEKFDIFSLGGFKIRKDFNEVIPYEGNEHLLGTTDDYEEPKWKPKENFEYFRPCFADAEDAVVPTNDVWFGSNYEQDFLRKGWVFQTKEECQAFCDRLNEAIKNVK